MFCRYDRATEYRFDFRLNQRQIDYRDQSIIDLLYSPIPNGTQVKYTEQSATNVPLRSTGT